MTFIIFKNSFDDNLLFSTFMMGIFPTNESDVESISQIYFKIIFLFYFKVHHLSEHKWQNCEHNNAAAYSVDVFFS